MPFIPQLNGASQFRRPIFCCREHHFYGVQIYHDYSTCSFVKKLFNLYLKITYLCDRHNLPNLQVLNNLLQPMSATKQIFFSYSDFAQDRELYLRLNRHFSSYVRNKLISIIDKDVIFKQSADKNIAFDLLRKSDITVPLLSADYLANEECFEMLKTAVSEKKNIIPILIREVDIESDENLKSLKDHMLPADGKSVLQHFDATEDDDVILVAVTKRIKDAAFKELESVHIAHESKTFYYILAAVVLGMGICAAIYTKNRLEDITVAVFVLLLFVSISLFALKNALFPTSFKKNR